MEESLEAPARSLEAAYPHRETQIDALLHLFSSELPSPPAVVVYGPEATGKSSVINAVLGSLQVPHAVVHCQECITARHVFERTVSSCQQTSDTLLDSKANRKHFSARCENVNVLAVELQSLVSELDKFVLVFDGIDQLRDAPATTVAALTRLQESVFALTVVFILRLPPPPERSYSAVGIPHLYFPSYNKEEACNIVACSSSRDALNTPLLADQVSFGAKEQDVEWLWQAFCASVWDTLAQAAANDVVSFRRLAEKMWRPFIKSVEEKSSTPIRDFPRHWLANRSLFSDEHMLIDRIISIGTSKPTEEAATAVNKQAAAPQGQTRGLAPVDESLPKYQEYLLCSAYLASYNPARRDYLVFTRHSEKKRKRKGGATRAARGAKHEQISRRLLKPSSFPLERLLAIFHAIFPIDYVKPTADLHTQIASLTSLRLIVRSGIAAGDVLDPSVKWRVNVGWDFVVAVGRSVGFEISEYILD
ncbi:MAG: hypothetical protein M1828_001140 [Chrysothrix sp. TS-e1954]|nr:MAG: hypothetical protein M1828_001140 [Chrysothrix sp. TS-e1954]